MHAELEIPPRAPVNFILQCNFNFQFNREIMQFPLVNYTPLRDPTTTTTSTRRTEEEYLAGSLGLAVYSLGADHVGGSTTDAMPPSVIPPLSPTDVYYYS